MAWNQGSGWQKRSPHLRHRQEDGEHLRACSARKGRRCWRGTGQARENTERKWEGERGAVVSARLSQCLKGEMSS